VRQRGRRGVVGVPARAELSGEALGIFGGEFRARRVGRLIGHRSPRA
jgi:hypothetical protein